MPGETCPIKLLIIASGDLWAGAEAVVHQLAVGLHHKHSMNVSLVLLNHGRLEKICREAGVQTHVLDEGRYSFPSVLWKLVNICRSIRPDIIHSHRYKENLLAVLAGPFCGRPKLVTTVHGLSEVMEIKLKGAVKGKINDFLLKRIFDKTVAVSDDIAQKFSESNKVPLDRLEKVLNGIEVPVSQNTCNQTDKNRLTIGSAGRLFPVKDYPLMVDIAQLVCAKRSNVRFVLAGDGPEKSAILQRIRSTGLEKQFILMGHMDDMQTFYASIDIYINTSHHEGIPLTVLEAMSWRKPVVAFAVGGLKEIVSHGDDGYLIQERKITEFSEYLIRLTDNAETINSLGNNAKHKIMNMFSTQSMINSYFLLFENLFDKDHINSKIKSQAPSEAGATNE